MVSCDKKKPSRVYTYQVKYEKLFGLGVTFQNEKTGAVEACVCHFCECWGREGGDEELETGGRKRKKTTNNQHWKQIFRADNICGHVTKQHSQNFSEYEKAQKTMDKSPEAFKRFFDKSTVNVFFEKRSTIVGKKRIFTIDNNIVKVIVKEILMPPKTAKATDDENENGEGDCPCEVVPPVDRGMRVFQPIYVNYK